MNEYIIYISVYTNHKTQVSTLAHTIYYNGEEVPNIPDIQSEDNCGVTAGYLLALADGLEYIINDMQEDNECITVGIVVPSQSNIKYLNNIIISIKSVLKQYRDHIAPYQHLDAEDVGETIRKSMKQKCQKYNITEKLIVTKRLYDLNERGIGMEFFLTDEKPDIGPFQRLQKRTRAFWNGKENQSGALSKRIHHI